jgi:hypothetical protein
MVGELGGVSRSGAGRLKIICHQLIQTFRGLLATHLGTKVALLLPSTDFIQLNHFSKERAPVLGGIMVARCDLEGELKRI